MKTHLVAVVVVILGFFAAMPVCAEVTVNVRVDDGLVVTYEFKNLDQEVFEQAKAQFSASKIPETIASNLEKANQTVQWSLGATSPEFEDASRTIRSSFFLGGSAVLSFSINKTELKRRYEVKTDWRKIKVDLTNSFFIDFAQFAAQPVAEWQKLNATTFYFENRETGGQDIVFYIALPSSASRIRAEGDTVFYDLPAYLEDQLLYSPFPVLGALAVALAIIVLYRRIR